MKWLRIDSATPNHPKFLDLDHQLGEERTIGYWLAMLCYFGQYDTARAVFAPHQRRGVESACRWRGAEGRLIQAFIDVGLVDEREDGVCEVHDWSDYQGKAIEKSKKDAEAKREKRRLERERRDAARAAPAPRRSNGAPTSRHDTSRNYSPSSPLFDDEREAEQKKRGSTGSKDARQEAAQPRSATNDAETKEGAGQDDIEALRAFAATFVMWANSSGAAETGGPGAYAWVLYRFQKYAGDVDGARRFSALMKLAWADFTAWCAAAGKTPGWGLFMEENVGDVRIDEARAGLLPRAQQPNQKALTLGPIGAVPAKKVAT